MYSQKRTAFRVLQVQAECGFHCTAPRDHCIGLQGATNGAKRVVHLAATGWNQWRVAEGFSGTLTSCSWIAGVKSKMDKNGSWNVFLNSFLMCLSPCNWNWSEISKHPTMTQIHQIHQAADRDASSSMNSLAPLIRMLHASQRQIQRSRSKKHHANVQKKDYPNRST